MQSTQRCVCTFLLPRRDCVANDCARYSRGASKSAQGALHATCLQACRKLEPQHLVAATGNKVLTTHPLPQVEMCNVLSDIEIAQSLLEQREESEPEEEQEQVTFFGF